MRYVNDKFMSFAARVELKKLIHQSNELRIIDPYVNDVEIQVVHKRKKHILFFAITKSISLDVRAAFFAALSQVATKLSLSLIEL